MIYDYAIVGAGIAGASVASSLAQTATVLLLEAESQPGYHATGRSAAMYIDTYGNHTVRALTRAGHDFYHQPPNGFSEHPLVSPRGALFIARQDQREVVAGLFAEFVATNPNIRRHNGAFATHLCPVLKREYVDACLWVPDAMDIDVHTLHQGYLRQFAKLCGNLKTNTKVRALEWFGDRWQIESEAGLFEAAIVVNAAGAWADEIAVLAGARKLNLAAKRRTAVLFDPPDQMTVSQWPLVIDVDENFYFKPDAGKILASPADETTVPPCDVQAEEWDVAVVIDRIEQATRLSPRHLSHKWAGLRTFAPDKSPVVGFDPRVEGFFWLAGQGGSGIQTAPALAQIAAALLQGTSFPTDISELGVRRAMFDPARFNSCDGPELSNPGEIEALDNGRPHS